MTQLWFWDIPKQPLTLRDWGAAMAHQAVQRMAAVRSRIKSESLTLRIILPDDYPNIRWEPLRSNADEFV